MKKWSIAKADPIKSKELSDKSGLSSLCSQILVSRGIDTYEKAKDFFGSSSDESLLPDPFSLKDIQIAVDVINETVENGDLICVYGDYDCDGITSTTILYSYLECLGANVIYHINQRSDGYGLCENGIRKLNDLNVKLIITVDNGISSVKECALAKELGMEIIVTDHHQPPEILPEVLAIINPHQKDCPSSYKNLCGCGVAFKLIAALEGGDYSSAFEQFSDITAIATIADIVPITAENRTIVSYGLRYLENTENVGLRSLIELSDIKVPLSSTDVAFKLAPRINSAGRIGNPMDAVRLLLSDNPSDAKSLADDLNSLNAKRKTMQDAIVSQIIDYVNKNPMILQNKVLVFYGEDFHHGIIGLTASKLVEQFGKPVFVISKNHDGTTASGSARSVDNFSIHASLKYCEELLLKFGGHFGAGGFTLSIEKIGEFNRKLQEYTDNECEDKNPTYTVHADKLITPEELSVSSVESLDTLKPFGEGNKTPVFFMSGARLLQVIPLKNGAHTKLKITYGKNGFYALMFGQITEHFPYSEGDMLDMLVTAEINEYGGNKSVNLFVNDIRLQGGVQSKYFNAKYAYESYKRKEGIPKQLIDRVIPTRDELGKIFRLLKKGEPLDCDKLYAKISNTDINYCKFRISLDVFFELGFIERDFFYDTVTLKNITAKVDLGSSTILKELESYR